MILPLLFSACWFSPKAPIVYKGTLVYVQVKDVTGYMMKLINYRTYKYSIEVQTLEGRVGFGTFESDPIRLKTGDYVHFAYADREIFDLKVLDRPLYDAFF